MLIGYRSHSSVSILKARRFERYLAQEGLEHAATTRAERGETDQPGHEAFSRCAKTMMLVGDGSSAGFDRAIGLELEIVPEADPFATRPPGRLPIRVLWRNRPYANALVKAFHDGRSAAVTKVRTDSEGRATILLDRAGSWMLSVVYIERMPDGSSTDWQSTWSSLTLEAGR